MKVEEGDSHENGENEAFKAEDNEVDHSPKYNGNPVETASIFSILSFSWMNPLISIGKKRQLGQSDLYPPHSKHTAIFLSEKLEKTWLPALEHSRDNGLTPPRFWKHSLWPYRFEIGTLFIITALESAQRISSCIVLRKLVLWLLNTGDKSIAEGYGLALLFGFLALIYPITHHQLFNLGSTIGWKIRVQSMSLVNRKLLSLNAGSLAHITTGHCITLMSNDVRRFDELFIFVPFFVLAPIELMVVTLLIALELGAAPTFCGIGTLLALIPLQTIFARFLAKQRFQTVKFTDRRVKLTGEILNGILAVKMFGWESPFAAAIHKIRADEEKIIQRAANISAFNESMFFCGGALVALVTFSVFHATGGVLQPFKVFYVLSLLQLPRLWMCSFFPFSISRMAESSVSFDRLQKFLELPDANWGSDATAIPEDKESRAPLSGYQRYSSSGAPWLRVTNATFCWASSAAREDMALEPSLRNVDFEGHAGELLGISGKVGSGKSTLLSAVLGDLVVSHGSVALKAKKVAFSAQKPFIVAGSLKENILFGLPLDEERYQTVVESCALNVDISQLPDLDDTEIGERGVNLSGGQKARISLARAAYSDSEIVLLDDPLSAVDPAVGRHIFEHCICGLMKEKLVILVTHQLQYLPKCDQVVLLKDGSMADIGAFEELQKRVDFFGFIDESDIDSQAEEDARKLTKVNSGSSDDLSRKKQSKSIKLPRSASTAGLVQEEKRVAGNVTFQVYAGYARNFGHVFCFISFLFLLFGQITICSSDWFLATWSRQSNQGGFWSWLYIGLVLVVVTVSFVRSILFFVWTLNASSRIHNGMLSSVLKSPVSFFHANPVGRVLNRFSADQGMMDDMLPNTFFNFLQMLFICGGALVVVSIGVPWVTLGIIPLIFVFLPLRRAFICTSRELKRLEAVSRSPVYTHYAQTILGLSTIRAFGAEPRFEVEFRERLDANGQGYFAWMNCSRWLAFRLDTICAGILLAASILAVTARNQLSPTLVGLALTYTLQLAGQVQWCVRQSAETENLFTGVERALEYTKLPEERLRVCESTKPDPQWPTSGRIVIQNLTIRYRDDLEPVLRDISVTFEGGKNVGIVGRTGAGKSTLMLSLFRLVEASEGRIVIDDVDIAMIGLEDLRRRVMAIPQDPVLFGSSLRFNLDPFSEYSDSDLWEALAAVQLKGKSESLEHKLDTSMAEFGENFSVGERQLVCLARAILHQNRILIMDEATANVDLETDSLIQSTLRERFCDCTVLMIAHRMDTIIDAHRVLVLDRGCVAEYGSPGELLADEESSFSGMVRRTGPASEAILRKRAGL